MCRHVNHIPVAFAGKLEMLQLDAVCSLSRKVWAKEWTRVKAVALEAAASGSKATMSKSAKRASPFV